MSVGGRREEEGQLTGREWSRGGAARGGRERCQESQQTGWQGVRRRLLRGVVAFVPVLIFTVKAPSWSGTRRSVSSLATMPT